MMAHRVQCECIVARDRAVSSTHSVSDAISAIQTSRDIELIAIDMFLASVWDEQHGTVNLG